MLEEDAEVMLWLEPDFNIDEVRAIAEKLEASGAFVPGYIPAPGGFLAMETIAYTTFVEKAETILVPDRNVVSRMAAIARNGMPALPDATYQLAAEIMALCQSVDFMIEPSVAFHELAHRLGNDVALEELSWFRVADQNQHLAWIDIAMGRASSLPAIARETQPIANLAAPLNRWIRNYVVALKVGMLELLPLARKEKATALIEWMVSDFIVAGPGTLFATMYLSPRATKARMMKQLKSKDRERALLGVRNAAWDITYLSEFVRMVKSSDYEKRRFILATGDRKMAELAKLMFPDVETHREFEAFLATALMPWWDKDAAFVARLFCNAIEVAEAREPPTSVANDYVGDLIAAGEAEIRRYRGG